MSNQNNESVQLIKGPKRSAKLGATIILVIDLLLIAFSFLIFSSGPSLGYISILYVAFIIIVFGIITVVAFSNYKIQSKGIISIGLGIVIGVASAIDIDSLKAIVLIGQVVTGSSFFLISYLIFELWRKK